MPRTEGSDDEAHRELVADQGISRSDGLLAKDRACYLHIFQQFGVLVKVVM